MGHRWISLHRLLQRGDVDPFDPKDPCSCSTDRLTDSSLLLKLPTLSTQKTSCQCLKGWILVKRSSEAISTILAANHMQQKLFSIINDAVRPVARGQPLELPNVAFRLSLTALFRKSPRNNIPYTPPIP